MTTTILARSGDLEWQIVDEEVVILDLRTQCYLSLNRSGAALWPLVVAGTSLRQLVGTLVETFDTDESVAGRDVERLVAQLSDADLLDDDAPAEP